MVKKIEEVTLEKYEEMLIKANLKESKDPGWTYAILRRCFRVLKHDYNAFLEMYPVRKTDVINLERRLATMRQRLHLESDNYQELETHIANARVHRQQQRVDLLLIDYQNIIVRAEKLKQKELRKEYQKIFKETQKEYDQLVADLKEAIEHVEASQKTKDYSTALDNIEIIKQIAPKLGKADLVDQYTALGVELEATFEQEEASKAAEEKAKREEMAKKQAQEDEDRRKREEEEREALEETGRKMREEMAQKKREEELKKQHEEEERIRVEEAPLLQEKTESVSKKAEEIKEVEEKMTSEHINSTSPTEIAEITVDGILLISPETIGDLSPDHIANLSPTQIRNLTKDQIQALSEEQIKGLAPNQLMSLTSKQMQYFTPDQIKAFSPLQILDFSPNQRQALTYDQVVALTPDQLAGFTPKDWQEWDPEMLRWLTKEQLPPVIRHFSEEQVQFLTPQQLSWILDDLTEDRLQVVPNKQVEMLTKTKTKHVGEWVQWSTNIIKEDSERLLEFADTLVDQQQITKPNRYNVSRFALLQLLKSEEK